MRCCSSSRAGTIVAAVSRQLGTGFGAAVAIERTAPTVFFVVRCAEALSMGARTNATTIAATKVASRARDTSARARWERAGRRPAPVTARVMDVVGFEGGTIAVAARRTGIDSTRRAAHTR